MTLALCLLTAGCGEVATTPTAAESVAPPPETPSTMPTVSPPEARAPSEAETMVTEAPRSAATAVPGARPPSAGTYPYQFSVTDAAGSRESDGVMMVEPAREVAGEIRQGRSGRDDGEEGEADRSEYAWREDGVYLVGLDVGPRDAEGSFDCDWEPDLLMYPLPLTVGSEWRLDSSCERKGGNGTATVHERSTVRILRTDRIVVAGEEVAVYVTEERESSGEDWDVRSTAFFAPAVGLIVRAETVHGFHDGGEFTETAREEFELMALRPQ